jgi:hypothetical protein
MAQGEVDSSQREQMAREAIVTIAKVCDRLPPQDALLALRRVREDVLERFQEDSTVLRLLIGAH